MCVPGLSWQLVWRANFTPAKKWLNMKFYISVCHFKHVDRHGVSRVPVSESLWYKPNTIWGRAWNSKEAQLGKKLNDDVGLKALIFGEWHTTDISSLCLSHRFHSLYVQQCFEEYHCIAHLCIVPTRNSNDKKINISNIVCVNALGAPMGESCCEELDHAV